MNRIKKFFSRKHSSPYTEQYQHYIPQVNDVAWTNRSYTHFAEESYARNAVAHRAIRMIAQSAASVELKIIERRHAHVRILHNHPLLQLLRRPNVIQSGKEFMEHVYSYRLIDGNAYILALRSSDARMPKELVSLRPDRVRVVKGDSFVPAGYVYTVDGKEVYYKLHDQCDVLHLKNFHPLSDWYGLSSVEAAAYSIDQHNQAGKWNQAFLRNGARPSGALRIPKAPYNVTAQEDSNFRRMLEESLAGAANAGRTLLLYEGMDWKEMGASHKDIDFIDSKHSAARDIALAFGLPPQLLGIPGDNTYSNLIEARIAFWEQTVLPLVENTLESLNHWLVQARGEAVISYDRDNIPALTAKRETMWGAVNNADFLTMNEKRNFFGFPSSEQFTIPKT